MRTPIASLHRVSPEGSIELVAANVPYSSLLWTRRLTKPGEFDISLDCPMPVPWPGRYLLTVEGEDEVGVVEKCSGTWDGSGSSVSLSGGFAEALWSRYELGPGGETARGAGWRQAVTAALGSWHMPDVPPLAMGAGTEEPAGSSYALSGGEGDTASETIYSCCEANGSRPVIGYDRAADPSSLSVRLVDGLDRTRSQSARPWCVLSLQLGTADQVEYSGDYSVGCSEVVARADSGYGDEAVTVDRTVSVPGFDPDVQWAGRAFEDVSSLVGHGEAPTAQSVDRGALLRAYDHMPSLAVDCAVSGEGYRETWDLGDLVEAEVTELGLVARERVEEVRETYDERGFRLEVTVGTKQIDRNERIVGRR